MPPAASPAPEAPRYLTRPDGARIAYHRTDGKTPWVVFMTGFRSDMTGGKALALEAHCRARGQAFLRFDYTGHGASSGQFTDGTIGQWAADARAVVEELTVGPLVLIGSSMGGWIMLLTARALKHRIAGLIGIAAAPDFTEDLMWPAMSEPARAALARDGVIYEPSQYDPEPTPITKRLIEGGRDHLVLRAPLDLDCPVRLIHGMKDPDVPYELAFRIAATLTAADVELILVKSGDHRLSEPHDLARLTRTLDGLLDRAP